MIEIGLIGGGFQHAYSSTWWKKPKTFIWVKNQIKEITCFIDETIVENINTKCDRKIGWIVESSAIIESVIKDITKHYKKISESYEFIISHDRRIIGLADNFYYLPPHGYWIENPQLYPKTKICSMITSNKRMCSGHNYRLDWMEKLKNTVDVYGRGFNDFEFKEQALSDYMFSITIENDSYETYWSEKILDCFACGTIPIYHGAPDIGNYFNMDGIIILDNEFDINNLTTELYLSKEDAIIDNYNRCLQYDVIEDIIYHNFINKNQKCVTDET